MGLDWGEVVEYRCGKLFWKVNTYSGKCYNLPAAIAGKEICSKGGNGYVTVRFKGFRCYRHNIVWMLHHGIIPEGFEVDHILSVKENNGIADDRIENLQLLKRGTNVRKGCGAKPNKSNKSSSRRGVSWDNGFPSKPWRARITIDKKVLCLNFENFEDAVRQRELWEAMYCTADFDKGGGK